MIHVRHIAIVTAILGAGLLGFGCNKDSSVPTTPEDTEMNSLTDGQSPAPRPDDIVETIKSCWQMQVSSISKTDKNSPIKRLNALVEILQEVPSESVRTVVDSLILGGHKARVESDFSKVLYEAAIAMARRRADANTLIRLLASDCPHHIGSRSIEFYIVYQPPPGLSDPISVFFKAYAKSADKDNKSRIRKIMARAFVGLVPHEQETKNLVARCEKWYYEHRESLSVNIEYAYNLSLHFGDPVPLFTVQE